MAGLIDIIFILLIFFAVSSTIIVNRQGLMLQLPLASTTAEAKPSLVLSVTRDQEIYLGKEKIDQTDIQERIRTLASETPTLQLTIEADQDVTYQAIIEVLDEVRLGGVFDIVLEAKERSL